MNKKLIMHCGNFVMAEKHHGSPLLVIGQSTETGLDMLAKGRDLCVNLGNYSGDEKHVFTNCDHVMNGIRLAAKGKLIDPSAIVMRYHREPGKSYINVSVNEKGRLDSWPHRFFNGFDIALNALLDIYD